ncbi:MAG: nickel pincer cofactor biosynthesis protein LarC [Akkermansiaceae bacterium]|nr:nickel pincer cofactor biosynthesis protein LarC [Akkermansiaceae bacterium]
MKTAYFDCIAGASGDMILGALVDAGLPAGDLEAELAKLHLKDFHLHVGPVMKNCFSATKVDVHVHDDAPERHLADLRKVVEDSDLSEAVKTRAVRIFTRICEAEAAIHNSSVDEVHLHEVGGVDAIVDVCGALAGLEALGIGRVVASPLPVGRGFITGAHGNIPLPAPAALALMKGCPIVGSPIDAELVTPTGAAVLSEVANAFGPVPAMTLESIGYGAGTRDLGIPNVLRVMLGQGSAAGGLITETLTLLETNLDDESPELTGHVSERLLEAGALDVTVLPAHMKKNRPGVVLQILARSQHAPELEEIVFRESSTLGVRRSEVQRDSLPRRIETVETRFGKIRVKVATLPDGKSKVFPEFEDCRHAARQADVAVREVYKEAEHMAAHALGLPHSH